jgi:acetolactate synthase-1/2/3 large subunit
MKINGSRLVIEALKREGVEYIFGFPGGAVIPIFDELYGETSLKVILTRHEQGAVHAADGYARSTGKTGVCLVTSGPGATNTVTGLATANFDSVPIVCLTGQVPTNMIGNDAFQEADTVGLSRSVTKHNYLASDRKELGRIMREAFHLAGSGRPGPVLVDIPKDILTAVAEDSYPDKLLIRGYNPNTKGHPNQIKKAAELLFHSKRPLFYMGGGIKISGGSEVFKKIVEKTGVPVITSLMGIGTIPSDHPLYLGMLGMHGTYKANMAVTESDLLFAVGTRFDDRATGVLDKFAPHAKIVHVDIDPAAIARNVKVTIPIVGDAKLVLDDLLPQVKKMEIEPWMEQIRIWDEKHPLKSPPHGERLSPTEIIKTINDVFPDAIISSEVGQNQMWAALFYTFREPMSWLTSGGLGTMGYGFPAAIGAQVGNPDKRVVDIAGDGSIQMNIQELATAVHNRLPVIIAILNNGYLGMVRQWQEMFKEKRYSSTNLLDDNTCLPECSRPGERYPAYTPDFVKLAEAYGALGIRVSKPEDVAPALIKAKETTDRPIIIDFLVEREANVWPMVPPGAGLSEMLVEGGEKA